MSFYLEENNKKSIIRNGKLEEEITNKKNINGIIKTEKIINKGILDNGKLRKKPVFKQVSFSNQKEMIEPKKEYIQYKRTLTPYYPNNKTIIKQGKQGKNKSNKTKKNKNRKIKIEKENK